jgi:hypothetical protein
MLDDFDLDDFLLGSIPLLLLIFGFAYYTSNEGSRQNVLVIFSFFVAFPAVALFYVISSKLGSFIRKLWGIQ